MFSLFSMLLEGVGWVGGVVDRECGHCWEGGDGVMRLRRKKGRLWSSQDAMVARGRLSRC